MRATSNTKQLMQLTKAKLVKLYQGERALKVEALRRAAGTQRMLIEAARKDAKRVWLVHQIDTVRDACRRVAASCKDCRPMLLCIAEAVEKAIDRAKEVESETHTVGD